MNTTNTMRGDRVAEFVLSYQRTWEPGEPLTWVVIDIVTDLLHFLADEAPEEVETEGEPTSVLDCARSHFEAERAELATRSLGDNDPRIDSQWDEREDGL